MAKTLARLALLAAVISGGCDRTQGPPTIGYFLESPASLDGINRVVLVDLAAEKGSEEDARNMTRALDKALQGSRLFHIEAMDRTHAALRDLALDKRTTLTLEEIRVMREQLHSDAILFGAVTQCNVYPRMEVGLYLRLLDLQRGEVVWAVDHTWDTTDKMTEERMKKFFNEQMREGYGPADWRLVAMSPLTFQKFIAHEIVTTLPASSLATNPGRAPGP